MQRSVIAIALVVACAFHAAAATAAPTVAAASFPPAPHLNCSAFNPQRVRLISFDVFAALMDTADSLVADVSAILPSLSQSQVESFVDQWLGAYGAGFGQCFDPSVTGPKPFVYIIENGLTAILQSMQLSVDNSTFSALMATWGHLRPHPTTAAALQTLQNAGYELALLSNGDHDTLVNASHALPGIDFVQVLSSDFPVMCFKPQPQIYSQALQFVGAADQFVHVAGSGIDAKGAREYGVLNVLTWDQPDAGAPPPCAVLSDISQLPAFFGL